MKANAVLRSRAAIAIASLVVVALVIWLAVVPLLFMLSNVVSQARS